MGVISWISRLKLKVGWDRLGVWSGLVVVLSQDRHIWGRLLVRLDSMKQGLAGLLTEGTSSSFLKLPNRPNPTGRKRLV